MEITIQQILVQLNQTLRSHSETPMLDAQVLIAYHLDEPRAWVLAHPEFILNDAQHKKIRVSTNRLEKGEPLPYVIGHWEFYGLDFQLTHDVLIPRPETELLVDRALAWLRAHPNRRVAGDVGTGSGCIGISLAKNIPDLQLLLTDISPKALTIARINAEKHNLLNSLSFIQADMLDGIVRPFDLICANLPYIPSKKLGKLPVAQNEPTIALDGGLNGTDAISKLLTQAKKRLISGGLLLVEIESSQGLAVRSLAKKFYPLSKVEVVKDLSGLDRDVEIERPNLIVHLCTRDNWTKAQNAGIYRNKSMEHEGFIHCSQSEQILDVANRFYHHLPEMVALWIDPDKLNSELRWEYAEDAFFPHIYGPINLDSVVVVTELKLGADGNFNTVRLPESNLIGRSL